MGRMGKLRNTKVTHMKGNGHTLNGTAAQLESTHMKRWKWATGKAVYLELLTTTRPMETRNKARDRKDREGTSVKRARGWEGQGKKNMRKVAGESCPLRMPHDTQKREKPHDRKAQEGKSRTGKRWEGTGGTDRKGKQNRMDGRGKHTRNKENIGSGLVSGTSHRWPREPGSSRKLLNT